MWVYGYGSLVWRADFPYVMRLGGYIKGYARRFWQYSPDHRGVPEKEKVWGAAYRIADEDIESVSKHLDIRECGGYEKLSMMFYPCDPEHKDITQPFELMLFVGTEENTWYAGPADLDTIAKTVVTSSGKSGSNVEYVYKLAEAMRNLAPGVQDEHLFSLEETVRKLKEACDS